MCWEIGNILWVFPYFFLFYLVEFAKLNSYFFLLSSTFFNFLRIFKFNLVKSWKTPQNVNIFFLSYVFLLKIKTKNESINVYISKSQNHCPDNLYTLTQPNPHNLKFRWKLFTQTTILISKLVKKCFHTIKKKPFRIFFEKESLSQSQNTFFGLKKCRLYITVQSQCSLSFGHFSLSFCFREEIIKWRKI